MRLACLLKACRQKWRTFSSPVHRPVSHGYPAPPCYNNGSLPSYNPFLYIYNVPIIHLFSGPSTIFTASVSTQFIYYIYIHTTTLSRTHILYTHNYISIRNYNWRRFGQRGRWRFVSDDASDKQCAAVRSGDHHRQTLVAGCVADEKCAPQKYKICSSYHHHSLIKMYDYHYYYYCLIY